MGTSRTITSHGGASSAWATDAAQGTIGYAKVTATQGSITTEVDLTSLTTTVTVVAGRRIRVRAVTSFFTTVADDTALLRIYQDGSQVAQELVGMHITSTGYGLIAEAILTPSAGAHTYKLTAARNNGSGTLSMFAAANAPAFIIVEDIGT